MARPARIQVSDENGETSSFISVSSVESLKSISSQPSTSSSSPLSQSDSDEKTATEGEDSSAGSKSKSLLNIDKGSSRFSSTSSLASVLGLSIPSHQQFGTFIHKHEVPRKFLHVSIGFITLWLYTIGVQLSQVTPVLIAMLAVILSIDVTRLRSKSFNKMYLKYVGFLMREKEINEINGVVWYLAGLIFVFLLFPKDICLLAVLLLSWADTAASTFGRAFGYLTPKIGNKSLAGSLAAFATGMISCWLLYDVFIPRYDIYNRPGDISWRPELSSISLTPLIFLSGLIGSVSEAIDIMDDNLTIPVASATLMWAVIKMCTVKSYESGVFA